MAENNLEGSVFSVPMFFNQFGEIDFVNLRKYLEVCVEQNSINILYSMAYNTRYMQLNYDEIITVNKMICEIANSAKKLAIIGHPLNLNNKDLHNYIEVLSDCNPYAFSILYPERYFGNDDAVLQYLRIPEKYNQNLIIHEMQLISGFNGALINWPKHLLSQALNLPNCVGIKEDSKDDQITKLVIDITDQMQKNIILAGGGKRRAVKFMKNHGLRTWLNGSLMLNPAKADRINSVFLSNNVCLIEDFIKKVEVPYFDEFISHVGWHVGHKYALSLAGYCENYERAPMPTISDVDRDKYETVVRKVISSIKNF
jgi:dihydrodipicolinate synthase/N-acetylneuraminate lyase